MRRYRLPLFIALFISLGLGVGLGWKLQRDRAAQLGVVTSSKKLKILALTGAFPPEVLKGFRSEANINVELIEEPTPDALYQRLTEDASFDLVTLMTSQTPRALQAARIQPFKARELKLESNISRDFTDLPESVPTTVPFLWGLLGLSFNPETVEEIKSWRDVFDLDRSTSIYLKPYLFELSHLARIGMPEPFSESAAQDRIKKFSQIYKSSDRFLVDPATTTASGDVIELSFSEATIAAYRDLKFVLPSEGALLWILNLALTASTTRETEAKSFVDYILRPEVAIEISRLNHEASTNRGVEASGLLPTQKPSALRRIPLTQVKLLFDETKKN